MKSSTAATVRCVLFLGVTALALAGCNKPPDAQAKSANGVAERPLLIAQMDLRTLQSQPLSSGPVITGTVQPERRADLRAEVSAVVQTVLKENGDAVKRGELLVRLDDTSIRDSMDSAAEGVRSASQSAEQTERQLQRLKTLQAQGMSSTQAMEDAQTRRNTAQSDLVAAQARAAAARQQLQRTEVRAPFDGVVSERKVSAGDTAQVGKELLKVIDPKTMRFEGLVSADRINDVAVGQTVSFRVNGLAEQEFLGKIKRIDAAANPTTRQVEVMVGFEPGNLPRVTGLYAEGRIAATSRQALLVPESALVITGESAIAWRVKGGSLSKVSVKLGERDVRRGEYIVLQGLVEGDMILRNPSLTLKDGQKVELRELVTPPTAAPAPAAVASSAAKGG